MAIFKILKALEFKLGQLKENTPSSWIFKLLYKYKIYIVEIRITELKKELYIRKYEAHKNI